MLLEWGFSWKKSSVDSSEQGKRGSDGEHTRVTFTLKCPWCSLSPHTLDSNEIASIVHGSCSKPQTTATFGSIVLRWHLMMDGICAGHTGKGTRNTTVTERMHCLPPLQRFDCKFVLLRRVSSGSKSLTWWWQPPVQQREVWADPKIYSQDCYCHAAQMGRNRLTSLPSLCCCKMITLRLIL